MIEVEQYQQLIRILSAMGISFFGYMSFHSCIEYFVHKQRGTASYLVMNVGSFTYSCLIFASTFYLGYRSPEINVFLQIVIGLMTYLGYLFSVESFLKKKNKLVTIAKYGLLTLFFVQTVNLMLLVAFDNVWVFESEKSVNLSKYMIVTYQELGPNEIGKSQGALCSLFILIGSIGILTELIRDKKKEKLLITGVFLTLFVTINDVLVVSGMLLSVPLFPLGNAFESIRFYEFFKQKMFNDMFRLEKENEAYKLSKKLLKVLSHDVANGLAIISGSVVLLKDNIGNHGENLERIELGARSISEICENVRKFESNSPIKLRQYPLKKILGKAEQLLEGSLKNKNVRFHLHLDSEELIVSTDPDLLLHEVILNILTNAIKFTPKGGVIDVFAQEANDKILISIKDNGVGISKERLDMIENRIEICSTKGTEQETGTGFGLMLIYKFVDTLQAKIEVTSCTVIPNNGTTISLWLPRAPK